MCHTFRLLFGALAILVLAPFNYTDPLEFRTRELLAYVGREMGYDTGGIRVKITFVDDSTLNKIYFGQNYQGRNLVVGVAYEPDRIFLPLWFRLGRHDDILVHELVHIVQYTYQVWYPCPDLVESHAYAVQSLWMLETGIWDPEVTSPHVPQIRCPWLDRPRLTHPPSLFDKAFPPSTPPANQGDW